MAVVKDRNEANSTQLKQLCDCLVHRKNGSTLEYILSSLLDFPNNGYSMIEHSQLFCHLFMV